jgi:hypothetical protein
VRGNRGRRLSDDAGRGRGRAVLTRGLRPGELVGAIGGLGLLVALFLPWYLSSDDQITAWKAFSVTDIVLAAAAAVALSIAICVVFRISVSYPVAGSSVATGLGFVAATIIVIRMINPPGYGAIVLQFGAWLGLASAIAITIGGYLGMQPLKAPKSPSTA